MIAETICLLALSWAAWSDFKTYHIPFQVHVAILTLAFINYFQLGFNYIIGSLVLGFIVFLFFRILPKKTWRNFGGGDAKLLISMAFLIGGIAWIYWLGFSLIFGAIHCFIDRRKHIPFGIDLFLGYLAYLISGSFFSYLF